MFYTAQIEHCLPDNTPVSGCGCDWTGTLGDVAEIGDAILTPGDESPAGRCPECGGLVYVVTPVTRARDAAPAMLTLLERVGQVIDMSNPEHPSFVDSGADCLQVLCEMEGDLRATIASARGEA